MSRFGGVLALILLDWVRVGRQVGFIVVYALASYGIRKLMLSVQERDRWYIAFIWLALCGLAADWAGFHFMVGAFLAGVVIDADWFDQKKMDMMRDHILMTIMPVFFLSTGLRTNWSIGSEMVLVAALALLAAQIAGKLLGVHIAGKILKWPPGEASIIGWLLQTKALIMIIFVNILLDKDLITAEAFTALLLMAIASTMLTIPVVSPKLQAAGRFIFQTMQKQSAP
jgi:Kef-type K+ transport system membrane component KefB